MLVALGLRLQEVGRRPEADRRQSTWEAENPYRVPPCGPRTPGSGGPGMVGPRLGGVTGAERRPPRGQEMGTLEWGGGWARCAYRSNLGLSISGRGR
jgi:hypothetical protein